MIRRGLLKEYASTISVIIRVTDMLAVLLAAVVSYYIKFGKFTFEDYYKDAFLLGVLLVPVIFSMFDVYRSWRARNPFQQIRQITVSWGMVILSLVAIASLMKQTIGYSREWFIYWVVTGWVILLVSRLLITSVLKYFRSSGWNSRKVLVVGTDSTAQELVQRVRDTGWAGIEVNGYIADDAESGRQIDGVPVRGGIANIDEIVAAEKIDEVWVVLPITMKEAVLEILRKLQYATVDVRYFLDFKDFRLMNHSITEIMGLPVVNLAESPMHGINRLIKALEDRLLAAVILIVISPLMLVIALLVKFTSPGPVLFKQLRHGWDGRKIKVYKFRTMYVHQEDAGQVTQAVRDDKRITPVGKFLRKTSLDELPQFFNVLQGRMSIVGPRPHAVQHNEYYKEQIEAYMLRHKVKPGITGWAQVNGWRGETDSLEKMQKRVEYDIFYIENWSLWFDLQIMFMTVFRGFVNKNAY